MASTEDHLSNNFEISIFNDSTDHYSMRGDLYKDEDFSIYNPDSVHFPPETSPLSSNFFSAKGIFSNMEVIEEGDELGYGYKVTKNEGYTVLKKSKTEGTRTQNKVDKPKSTRKKSRAPKEETTTDSSLATSKSSRTQEGTKKAVGRKRKSPDQNEEDSDTTSTPDSLKNALGYSKMKKDEPIMDKNGMFRPQENQGEYKKARKRKQNRESALRSRIRKKMYIEEVEDKFDEIIDRNKELELENASLKAENALLKNQIEYFQSLFAQQTSNNMLKAAGSTTISTVEMDYINSKEEMTPIHLNTFDEKEQRLPMLIRRDSRPGLVDSRGLNFFLFAVICVICTTGFLISGDSEGTSTGVSKPNFNIPVTSRGISSVLNDTMLTYTQREESTSWIGTFFYILLLLLVGIGSMLAYMNSKKVRQVMDKLLKVKKACNKIL